MLIEIQGSASAVASVQSRIQLEPPPLARITAFRAEPIPLRTDEIEFTIRPSLQSDNPMAGVAQDVSICEECLHELQDSTDRRFGYPFINCTHCGPRYTIIRSLPYDRQQTTMSGFPLCEACRAEYESPSDRRFHAEPNACPACGPRIWWASSDSSRERPWDPDASLIIARSESMEVERTRTTAIRDLVREKIASGQILAIKGIGGFHLACDATNLDAIQRLRKRKQRPDKPLAVMVSDVERVREWVEINPHEERILGQRERPIVLLRKRSTTAWIDALAPGNPYLGFMLAYSPLHYWLIPHDQVWVMTSGNLSDEPIARENEEAWQRLRPLVDGFLFHDRPIHTACDDSVLRVSDGAILPIRRSRGFAPLNIPLPTPSSGSPEVLIEREQADLPTVLAVGAEIKAAICLANGTQAIMSQHLGDMGNQESLKMLEEVTHHLCQLYRAVPQVIVADQHPGYLSGMWAQRFADSKGIPLLRYQHHHAHAASLMAEHDLRPDVRIVACIFDGTGYGTDGTIWGGEWMIVNQNQFERIGSLASAPLPGGDACIFHPTRTALAQLFRYQIPWDASLPCLTDWQPRELQLLRRQLERNIHCVETSSIGRLFDAVASLAGVRQQVHFEGQAAMELESLATGAIEKGSPSKAPYSTHWEKQTVWRLHCGEMLSEVIADHREGRSTGEIGARFHATLVQASLDICLRARAETGIELVGLTGGVFQNILLTRWLSLTLESHGFRVLTHRLVPPNDAGIALGQAVLARAALEHARVIGSRSI